MSDLRKSFADIETSREDMLKIDLIVKRAVKLSPVPLDMTAMAMDIEVAHHCQPLDLDQLLSFSDADFAHDLYGISVNLNRNSLTLENCFVPRCAIYQESCQVSDIQ